MSAVTAGSAEIADLVAPLRAAPARSAVLCDIDGTLAPIVADPHDARVPEAARSILRELAAPYSLVGCVSGRRASEARRMVGIPELTYAGNHGLELLGPGDAEPRLDPSLGRRGAAAAALVARLDWRALGSVGMRLEDKGPIQAIHWRGAPDEEAAEGRAHELASMVAHEGLVPHLGRKVLEVRPTDSVDKGTAMRRLLADAGARHALYGGDDVTDLDAFAALRALREKGDLAAAACVGVASAEAPSALAERADALVDGPAGFLEVLRALVP